MSQENKLQVKYKNIHSFPESELIKRLAFNEVEIGHLKPKMTYGNQEQIHRKKSRMQYMTVENKLISNELDLRERNQLIHRQYESKKREIHHMEIYIEKMERELMIARLERDVERDTAEKLRQANFEQGADIAFLEIRLKRVALHK